MCFLHTIDIVHSTALDFSIIKSYFDNLGELLRQHKYPPYKDIVGKGSEQYLLGRLLMIT